MLVAIQGQPGSFHNEAAEQLLSGQDISLVCRDSFRGVFDALLTEDADLGVIAIENSLHGPINAVYRLLDEHDAWIAGETTLHIRQQLIACQPVDISTLNASDTKVLSQAPALAQVESWLDEHLPLAHREETHDTAASVEFIMQQQNPHLLAVASKRAAELHHGTIIADSIEDDPHNYTRFMLLTRSRKVPPNATRTCIILTTNHTPGALFSALQLFAEAGINLSKLDSHPIPGDARHYAFYIDFESSVENPKIERIFETLKNQDATIKILGSYAA